MRKLYQVNTLGGRKQYDRTFDNEKDVMRFVRGLEKRRCIDYIVVNCYEFENLFSIAKQVDFYENTAAREGIPEELKQ